MSTFTLHSTTIEELKAIIRGQVQACLDDWNPPSASKSTDALLIRQEVLSLLRISSPTLRGLERTGRLRPIKRIGRKPLWRSTDVTTFLSMEGK